MSSTKAKAAPRRLKNSMHRTRSAEKQKAARKRAIVRLFKKFDADGDMYLTRKELKDFMRSLGMETDPQTVTHFLKTFDTDKNDKIGFAEFEAGLEKMNKKLQSKQDGLRAVFDKFDADSSGSINRSEVKKLLKQLGENYNKEAVQSLMKQFDKHEDGEITFEEFERYVLLRESEEQERKLYFEIFEQFDSNKDGQLDKSELEALLEHLGPRLSKKERHKMAKTLKKRGVGASREAFAEGLKELQNDRETFEEKVSDIFDEADKDGDGVIDSSELPKLLKSAGLYEHFSGDIVEGTMTYHEFRGIMRAASNIKALQSDLNK